MENSVDPDQTDLGPHCLLTSDSSRTCKSYGISFIVLAENDIIPGLQLPMFGDLSRFPVLFYFSMSILCSVSSSEILIGVCLVLDTNRDFSWMAA